MTEVVDARNLSRRFGRHWVLRDVSLEVVAGQSVALVGANGAGKSTLLSILATVLSPSRGQLRLFGELATSERGNHRRRLGYLAHATLLDDALTAAENLSFYADLYGLAEAPRCVERQLDHAGLAHRAQSRVETFSRGMRQRLSLARALIHDPELLLLDEPFSGLDAPSCRDLSRRLAEEKARGRSLVVATHQMEQILGWCDRVVVLHRGQIVEDTPARDRNAAEWATHLAGVAERGS